MAKAIHSMIRVLDEERSVDFYTKAFQFGVQDRFEFEGFTLVYLRNKENDFELELTINHDQTEAYSHGSGYGHLAVCVDDINVEHQRISELGFSPGAIKEFHREGELMAKFFFVQDPDEYKIEVLMKHGRYV